MTDTAAAPTPRNASIVVVGAGDYIGAAIARKFAREGYLVFMGRRNGDKLLPLRAEIVAAGGRAEARTLDAREEDQVIALIDEAERAAPVEVVVFNIGANVHFPLLETTARVFRKVWELACFAGFLTAREAARVMLRAVADRSSSPARPRGCAAGQAMPPSPARSSASAPSRRRPHARWGRRASTSRIW